MAARTDWRFALITGLPNVGCWLESEEKIRHLKHRLAQVLALKPDMTPCLRWEEKTPMSAKDLFHDAVKRGLEKDQWTISSDPLELEWDEVKVKIDLAAERLIAADRGEEKIAVEVKSFIGPSAISDFHTALGQFLNYRIMLEVNEPDRQLYLAVPVEIYRTFFQSQFSQFAIERHQLKLIVYDPMREEIVKWTN